MLDRAHACALTLDRRAKRGFDDRKRLGRDVDGLGQIDATEDDGRSVK